MTSLVDTNRSFHQKHVLGVVSDSATIRSVLQIYARKISSIEFILLLNSICDGLNSVDKHKVDLMIFDIRKERGKLLPAIASLRQRGIPTLVCCDPTDSIQRQALVRSGVTEIISDKVEFWEFYACCQSLLRIRKQEQQLNTLLRWTKRNTATDK